MKYRKTTLCIIIICLTIFLPITIFSTTKAIEKALYVENPNHEYRFENKLYFYDGEKLLGSYPCKNFDEICDLANASSAKDNEIILKEYDSLPIPLSVINDKYVFIKDTTLENMDNSESILYDLKGKQEKGHFNLIKNYGIGIDKNLVIVENISNKYGVIGLLDDVQINLPFEYDFIGLAPLINSETALIDATNFAVLKDDSWFLVDNTNSVSSNVFSDKIYNYNSTYIILKNDFDTYYITNFNGDKIFANDFNYLDFYDKYLVVIDYSNNFYLYDLLTSQSVTKSYPVRNIDDVTLTKEEGKIKITINNQVVETLAIA